MDADFESRLRGALSAEAAGASFEDGDGTGRAAVVAGVRRRHHQRAMALAGGVTVVAAVAVVATLGLSGSPGGGPHAQEGLRAPRSAPASAPRHSAAGAASGIGFGGQVPAAAPSAAQAPTAPCPVTRTAGATVTCSGSFVTVSGSADAASALGVSALSSKSANSGYATAQPFGAAVPPASSVSVAHGRRLTVVLPAATPFAHWARPTVTAGSSVLRPSAAAAHDGSWTATFTATRPGTATLSATAVCEASAASSATYASVCHAGTARWHLTVEVTR